MEIRDRAAVLPFTHADYASRMIRVADNARAAGLDGVIVTPGPDLVWLTGYRPTAITERLTMLILTPDQRPTLLLPILERPDAETANGAASIQIIDWADGTSPYEIARHLLRSCRIVGVSDSAWAVHVLGLQAVLPHLQCRALSETLPMMRAVKDDNELDRLARAGAAADATFDEIVLSKFAGRREIDVASDLARLLREFGHDQVDFTVVGSGPNGANPHHEAGERVIEQGDTVVLDFGGLMHGYGSDTTRTVHVGEPPAQVRTVHEIVAQAQQAAFDAVRPGLACQEIDRIARAVITEAGYGAEFIHRTGHGIGVTTHEPPYMVEGEKLPLRPGMTFSIEPGIYVPGQFGVRIEDIVMVTSDGGKRLNNTSHGLRIVE